MHSSSAKKITAPQFFFFGYGEDETAAQSFFFVSREDKTAPQFFFTHTAKTKKKTPPKKSPSANLTLQH